MTAESIIENTTDLIMKCDALARNVANDRIEKDEVVRELARILEHLIEWRSEAMQELDLHQEAIENYHDQDF